MSTGLIAGWDFTLQKNDHTHTDVYAYLREHCKKFAFQLESAPSTGQLHYQGRMSLHGKKRLDTLVSDLRGTPLEGCHLSPTARTNWANGNQFYVIKKYTRVDGPWTDQEEPRYIPRQIREIKELRPFQKTIVDNVGVWDTRHINFVYCPNGNNGKSTLVGYLRAHGLGRPLPPVNDAKDFSRMVCNLPLSNFYVVDMPRAMRKEKLYGFWTAIEQVKDGYAYDDRYHFKEKVFDCPNIWVFGNRLPDTHLMSSDRWIIHTINERHELVLYNPEML